MSSLKKVIVKNTTAMSLHERFTKIRKIRTEIPTTDNRVTMQLASARNRRLAQQMEKRPSVAAALKSDVSVKSRLGTPGALSVRDRLRLPRGFGLRRGRGAFGGKSPLTRGQLRADDSSNFRRGRSPFVASKVAQLRRSRSRSRGPMAGGRARSRSQSRARSVSNTRFRSRSRSRSGFRDNLRGSFSGRRGNRGGFRRGRGSFRGTNDLRSYRPRLNTNPRGGQRGRGRRGQLFRGRGLRGRGRGTRGSGRGGFNRQPSKEQLDRELDEYMSTTKSALDKDLDTMMTDAWN